MINFHKFDTSLYYSWASHLNFIFQIRLRLRIQAILLAGHFKIVRRFLITNNMFDQVGIPCASCFDLQLDSTSPIKEAEEEACFVDSAARR